MKYKLELQWKPKNNISKNEEQLYDEINTDKEAVVRNIMGQNAAKTIEFYFLSDKIKEIFHIKFLFCGVHGNASLQQKSLMDKKSPSARFLCLYYTTSCQLSSASGETVRTDKVAVGGGRTVGGPALFSIGYY